jgi:hypothetical protein
MFGMIKNLEFPTLRIVKCNEKIGSAPLRGNEWDGTE